MTIKHFGVVLLLSTGSLLAAGSPSCGAPRWAPALRASHSTWDRPGQNDGGWHNWGHGGWSAYGSGEYWGSWDW